ncbi:hypothetical protein [uncultured Sulfitobacter sp.]|uniref:hypothetical protein n=1 Tax=uncultured Sulfitobacter sp. TaxID=191468 RepID=UPI00262749BC|nr:hypothetical protein [uncultured Sulfitobacter sp.]
MRYALVVAAALAAAPASAERATYGDVYLNGLLRDQPTRQGRHAAMVCNVNGPDGYLSIRSGPGSDFKAVRKLKRLAVVAVDAGERRGRWIRVLGAHRDTTPEGRARNYRDLPVQGWAHDGYLCDFIH